MERLPLSLLKRKSVDPSVKGSALFGYVSAEFSALSVVQSTYIAYVARMHGVEEEIIGFGKAFLNNPRKIDRSIEMAIHFHRDSFFAPQVTDQKSYQEFVIQFREVAASIFIQAYAGSLLDEQSLKAILDFASNQISLSNLPQVTHADSGDITRKEYINKLVKIELQQRLSQLHLTQQWVSRLYKGECDIVK